MACFMMNDTTLQDKDKTMLDDQKKKLIEAEEEYRHNITQKIRAQVESAEQTAVALEKTFWQKVYEVANSNFGLWFLSSVLITGGAAVYQIADHHYVEKITTQRELQTCEFEIANRLNAMKFLLQKAKTVGDTQLALTPITKSFGAVSAEYDHVNIAVLYFKSYQLTGIRDKETEEHVKELEEINLAIQQANPKALLDEQIRNKLLKLISILQSHEIGLIDARKKKLF
jgi:hypothetical protein